MGLQGIRRARTLVEKELATNGYGDPVMDWLPPAVGCSQTVVLELNLEEGTFSTEQQRVFSGEGAVGVSGPSHQPLREMGRPDSGGKGTSDLCGDLA